MFSPQYYKDHNVFIDVFVFRYINPEMTIRQILWLPWHKTFNFQCVIFDDVCWLTDWTGILLRYIALIWHQTQNSDLCIHWDITVCTSPIQCTKLKHCNTNKAIRDGKYLALPHSSAWQRPPPPPIFFVTSFLCSLEFFIFLIDRATQEVPIKNIWKK